LLTGQFSDRSISVFSLSLSCCTSSQPYNIRSVVCSPVLQGHIELSIILYLYRYDLILPWPVTIIVRFGVTLIFNFNLSATLGKYGFVVAPCVVRSHSVCHFVSLSSLFHCTFWDSDVALLNVAVCCCLFCKFVCHLIPLVSCMCFDPVKFCFPVLPQGVIAIKLYKRT